MRIRDSAEDRRVAAVRRPGGAVRALGALLAGCLAAAPAAAHWCAPPDMIRAEANRVLTGLTSEIDAMEARIVEALRLQTGQLSGYTAQAATAVTEALEAQTKLQAQIAREVEETEVQVARRPSESACRTITGAAGLSGSREAAEAALARAAAMETGRIVNDRAVAGGTSPAARNAARFAAVAGTYCHGGRAGEAGGPCGGPEEGHAADLVPGALFDRRTFVDGDELRTAVELSRNLAAPVVYDGVPFASADTETERRRLLMARSADARAALASDYFADRRALRVPGVDLGGWAAAVAPGAGDGPLSRYELLETLASRRFEDPQWFVGLQGMSAENLLRELLIVEATALTLAWERYRLDERRGAMEAARLGAAAEAMRDRPGLANPAAGID